jgi:hypothetical protein
MLNWHVSLSAKTYRVSMEIAKQGKLVKVLIKDLPGAVFAAAAQTSLVTSPS